MSIPSTSTYYDLACNCMWSRPEPSWRAGYFPSCSQFWLICFFHFCCCTAAHSTWTRNSPDLKYPGIGITGGVVDRRKKVGPFGFVVEVFVVVVDQSGTNIRKSRSCYTAQGRLSSCKLLRVALFFSHKKVIPHLNYLKNKSECTFVL
jgi:hypothetical protein